MLGGVDYILEAVALSTLSSPTSDIQGDASERQRNRRAARAAPGCTGAKRPRERIQRSRMPTASPTSTANKLPSEQALQRVLICTGCTYVHKQVISLLGPQWQQKQVRGPATGCHWICMGSLLFYDLHGLFAFFLRANVFCRDGGTVRLSEQSVTTTWAFIRLGGRCLQ